MTDNIREKNDPQEQEITPTFTEVLRQAFNHFAGEMHSGQPGEVVKYDYKKQKMTVKPLYKIKNRDGTTEEAPLIHGVTYQMPRSGSSFISFPIKKGDKVFLNYADRSTDEWKKNGKVDVPADSRKHSMSDAFATLGGHPFSDAAKIANNKDVIIKHDKFEIRMKKSGKVQILNGKYDLMKIIREWMDASISGADHKKKAVRVKFNTFLSK